MNHNNETFVIKLGGSIIVPEVGVINVALLTSLKDLIVQEVANGRSFFIIPGGGKTCRNYQAFTKEIGGYDVTNEDLDWVGLFTNNLNSQVVRSIFPADLTYPSVIIKATESKDSTYPITVVGAEAPGHSGDYDAVKVAEYVGAKKILNLSNIAYVYDGDPKTNPDAKPVKEMSWDDYISIIPENWTPGLSTPFDPVAARMSKDLGLEVTTMDGTEISNVQNYFSGKNFEGSTLR